VTHGFPFGFGLSFVARHHVKEFFGSFFQERAPFLILHPIALGAALVTILKHD
jgi:hypothetical protein